MHRKPKSIISYRILVAKRSEGESACLQQSPAYVLAYTGAQKLREKRAPHPLFVKNAWKQKFKNVEIAHWHNHNTVIY